MYKMYNKKLKSDRSNPRLGKQRSRTLGLVIQITGNITLALPITEGPFNISEENLAFKILGNWF